MEHPPRCVLAKSRYWPRDAACPKPRLEDRVVQRIPSPALKDFHHHGKLLWRPRTGGSSQHKIYQRLPAYSSHSVPQKAHHRLLNRAGGTYNIIYVIIIIIITLKLLRLLALSSDPSSIFASSLRLRKAFLQTGVQASKLLTNRCSGRLYKRKDAVYSFESVAQR
jgi:hypothetical protein